MRVFLSYSTAPDKGEGRFYREVLARLGHEVHVVDVPTDKPAALGWKAQVTAGFPPETTFEELAAKFGRPDLFLYVEPDGLIPRDIGRAPCPTACVISDTHRRLAPRIRLARFFDHVFLYQRNYLSHFSAHPAGRVSWYPYACDTHFFRDPGVVRDLEVAFVGQPGPAQGERARCLAAIRQRWKTNPPGPHTQQEMAALYGRAKIVVNFPIGDDLNFRFFEALSCGALLITKRIANGQDALFKDGEHFVTFADETELLAQIAHHLAHPEIRERIAGAGHAECLRAHTLEIRLVGLLQQVGPATPGGAPVRSLGPVQQLSAWARWTARQGRMDALCRLLSAGHTAPAAKAVLSFHLTFGYLRRLALYLKKIF